MLYVPNLIIIGSNTRKAGKTSLACQLITKLTQNHAVIALKVSNLKKGDESFHGNHHLDPEGNSITTEELDPTSTKDTAAMLRAGASKAFYIRCTEDAMEITIEKFLQTLPAGQPVVCESLSLRNVLVPGIFIILNRTESNFKSKNLEAFLPLADKIVCTSTPDLTLAGVIKQIDFQKDGFLIQEGPSI